MVCQPRHRRLFSFLQLRDLLDGGLQVGVIAHHGDVARHRLAQLGVNRVRVFRPRHLQQRVVIFLGAIGGFMMSGFVGLFLGAVVLSLGYEMAYAWTRADDDPAEVVAAGASQ